MIRKYHNHKLQTNPWYREEEPHNNHETPGRQTKQSNQLSLPNRDDYKAITINNELSKHSKGGIDVIMSKLNTPNNITKCAQNRRCTSCTSSMCKQS